MRKIAPVAIGLAALLVVSGCATGGSSSSGVGDDKSLAAEAYENNRLEQAGEYYTKILKTDPNNVEALFRLGNIHAKNNQPLKAVEFYEKALAVKSDLSPAWRNLAVVRLRQGLAAMMKSQNHLSKNDPLYISNLEIIKQLDKVPGLGSSEKKHKRQNHANQRRPR